MIYAIFDNSNCKNINTQGFAGNLGWFQHWNCATLVFIEDKVYSFDSKPIPDDFGDLFKTFFIPRESDLFIEPKEDFAEDDWKEM